MSFILLGILNSQAAGAVETYFLSVIGGAGTDIGNSIGVGASSKIFVSGRTDSTGAGGTDAYLAKYDDSQTLAWQRVLGGASTDISEALDFDSAGNIYFAGYTSSDGQGSDDWLFAKYNSSGTIQFQKTLGGGNFDRAESVHVDSSDNVFIVGRTRSAGQGNDDRLVVKYDTSGTVQWQRILGNADADRALGISSDSSDNIYVVGSTASTGAGSTDSLLVKYDTSGTVQWQRVLGGASSETGNAVVVDSSDNIYISGFTSSTGTGELDLLVAKYNSSGTLQWQKALGGTGSDQGISITVDSSDNIYLLGQTTGATGTASNKFAIAKYNSSGTIQWQRKLGGTGSDQGISITVDSSDNIYAIGQTDSTGAGGTDILIAKVPNDGSLLGTYSLDGNNIVYEASSLTSTTATLTSSTASLTTGTPSLTSAASSLTDASANLTLVTTEI